MRSDHHRRSTAAAREHRAPEPALCPGHRASPRTSSRSTSTRRSGRQDARRRRSSPTSTAARSSIGDKANKIADKVEPVHRRGLGVREPQLPPRRRPGRGPDQRCVPRGRTGHRRRARATSPTTRPSTTLDAHAHHAARPLRRGVPGLARLDRRVVRREARASAWATSSAPRRSTRPTTFPRRSRAAAPKRRCSATPSATTRPCGSRRRRRTTSRPGKDIPAFHIVTRGQPAASPRAKRSQRRSRTPAIDADAQVVRGLTHDEVNAAVGQAGETVVTTPLMDFYRSCAS